MHKQTTAIAVALLAPTAVAGLTTTNNRAFFEASLSGLQIEDFESEALGAFAMPTIFSSGLGADFINGSVTSSIEAGDPDQYGFHNTTFNGRKYLRLGQNVPGGPPQTGSYTVDFSLMGPSAGFGFDISGFQPLNAAGGFNLTLISNGQFIEDIFVPSDQSVDEVRFFGFLSSGATFDTVRINIPVLNLDQAADHVAFDDITWGVPTPSSVALLGLGGLVGARRRR